MQDKFSKASFPEKVLDFKKLYYFSKNQINKGFDFITLSGKDKLIKLDFMLH